MLSHTPTWTRDVCATIHACVNAVTQRQQDASIHQTSSLCVPHRSATRSRTTSHQRHEWKTSSISTYWSTSTQTVYLSASIPILLLSKALQVPSVPSHQNCLPLHTCGNKLRAGCLAPRPPSTYSPVCDSEWIWSVCGGVSLWTAVVVFYWTGTSLWCTQCGRIFVSLMGSSLGRSTSSTAAEWWYSHMMEAWWSWHITLHQ